MNIEEAYDLAVKNISLYGFTDIFELNLEIELLKNATALEILKKEALPKLKQLHVNQLDIQPLQHVLLPKSRMAYDYRRAAILSPLCTINLLTAAILAAEQLENVKLANDVIFSHRFDKSSDTLFSNECGYSKWIDAHIRKKENPEINVIVFCDIASFYDRVNLHRIESTLETIGVDKSIYKLIDGMLKIWSQHDSYGIPIGSNGSRLLAEAAMIEIDNYLSDENVTFIRFVDDYRLYAPDLPTAQKWLSLLTTRLFRDGLMLNAAKTRVLDKKSIEQIKDDAIKKESAEQILKTVTTNGGYNKVARRFKMPATERLAEFNKIDIQQSINDIISNTVIEFEGIQKTIIAILVQQKYDFLLHIDEIIKRCLYGIDYIVDMLQKNNADIPEPIKKEISRKIIAMLHGGVTGDLDWYSAKLITILGIEGYRDNSALHAIIRKFMSCHSSLPLAKAVETLSLSATKTDGLFIRDLYSRFDEWSKRRAIQLVAKTLTNEELRAWFKTIRPTVESDIFTKMAFAVYSK